MRDHRRPRLRNWLIGTARGELSTSGLDGLRQAGSLAYSLAEEADRARQQAGPDPWRRDRGTQLFLVCAWNSFALQTAADQLVESDARADPLTAGLLPETTLAFTKACYAQSMTWVQHARCVQADAAYRVNVPLPAVLPPWQTWSQTTDVHLKGLRDAYEAVAPGAEYELGQIAGGVGAERASRLAELNLLATQMRTAVEFANGLQTHARSGEQRREVREQLLRALGCAYTLGQVVAMPSLTERLQLGSTPGGSPGRGRLTAIEAGWSVVDSKGAPVGTVVRLEGEPALGMVTALVVSVGAFAPDRRIAVEHIETVDHGVVRLAATGAELEPA